MAISYTISTDVAVTRLATRDEVTPVVADGRSVAVASFSGAPSSGSPGAVTRSFYWLTPHKSELQFTGTPMVMDVLGGPAQAAVLASVAVPGSPSQGAEALPGD